MELKNFKEALIAHLNGEKVEAMGIEGEWKPLMQKVGEGQLSYIDHNVYMDLSFRLALRTIIVNGVEVPAPESVVPEEGSEYFNPNVFMCEMFSIEEWIGSASNFRELERGLVYLNKDDAIARAKAMLKYEE